MGAFGGLILTNKGRALQAKVQAGATLHYTRIALGDGNLNGQSISDLSGMISEKKSLDITKLKQLGDGKVTVGAYLTNQGLATGFYFRELGVLATDPDLGEILYCYGNAGSNAEYIPAGGGPDIVEKNIDLVTIVGNAANVTATINQSLVYITQQDFDNHKNAAILDHPDGSVTAAKLANGAATDTVIGNRSINDGIAIGTTDTDTLTNILSKYGAQFRAITGGTDWFTNPAISLATVSGYLNQGVKTTNSPTFAGLTSTGELSFSDDGEGVTFSGGGRIYKRVGSGITIRRHTANVDPEVESYDGATRWKIWHAGNDGSGSTLDADTTDGYHLNQDVRSTAQPTFNGMTFGGEAVSWTDPNTIGGKFQLSKMGASTPNSPAPWSAVLNIPASANSDFQIASAFSGSNLFYMRGRYDGTGAWNAWEQLLTNVNHNHQDVKTTASPTFVGVTLSGANPLTISGGIYGALNFNSKAQIIHDGNNTLYLDTIGSIKARGAINGVEVATLSDTSGNSTFRTISSTVATGTAPFTVASTTKVNNLNVSLLEGLSADNLVGHRITNTNPAQDLYYLITTLPISGTGTYEKLFVELIGGNGWTSTNLIHDTVLMGNRDSFSYSYGQKGYGDRTTLHVIAYRQADNSVKVYLKANAASWTTGIIRAYGIGVNGGPTALPLGNSSTTVPTGTIVFDSGNNATYPANEIIWSGDITTSRLISTIATGTAPFTVSSTTKVNNLNVDKVDGYDFDQDLRTTAAPTFAALLLNGSATLNAISAEKSIQWTYATSKNVGLFGNGVGFGMFDWGNNRGILTYFMASNIVELNPIVSLNSSSNQPFKIQVPDASYRTIRFESPTKEHISWTRDAVAGKAMEVMRENVNSYTQQTYFLVKTDKTVTTANNTLDDGSGGNATFAGWVKAAGLDGNKNLTANQTTGLNPGVWAYHDQSGQRGGLYGMTLWRGNSKWYNALVGPSDGGAETNYGGWAFIKGNVDIPANQTDFTAVATIDGFGNSTFRTVISNVATGTSPFTVTSTTKVTNLNVDMLDGYHTGTPGTGVAWGYIPVVNTDGVMEVGKYIDFHTTSNDGIDNASRLESTANGLLLNNNKEFAAGKLTSTVATGTAPLGITSTTKVDNLNVDMVDGYHFDQDVRTTASPTFAGLNINAQDGVNEGGEIVLKPAGSYTGVSYIDRYQDNTRIFIAGGTVFQIPKSGDPTWGGNTILHTGNTPQTRLNGGVYEVYNGGWVPVGGIKSVQRGTTAVGVGASAPATVNVTISAVNLSKAFVVGTAKSTATGSGTNSEVKFTLTSSTNLEISTSGLSAVAADASWQVIEFY